MRRSPLVIVSTALLLAGCSDSPSGPAAGPASYVLVSVNGEPVPAIVDSLRIPERGLTLWRIVGKSVRLLSADNAEVASSTDVVLLADDGRVEPRGGACGQWPARYHRSGDRLILSYTRMGSTPGTWVTVVDTLGVRGEELVQLQAGSRFDPATRERIPVTHQLRFVPGVPSVPVCAPSPADAVIPAP